MQNSNIEWTGGTWNPTTGCDKVSAGCKFCYAESLSEKLKNDGNWKYRNGFKLTLQEKALNLPYQWKESQTIFVNSMSDLFHKDVPSEYLEKVFKVMNDNPHHTFQVLTKRPEILLQHDKKLNWTPNIWMGVSVEDDRVTDRIDLLRQSSAVIKFLSIEPLIGPLPNLNLENIDWVIVGGESGRTPRPMLKEWVLDIKDQCQSAGVPFFFKQWGGVNKKQAGRLLDGKTYDEMPVIKKTAA